MILKDNICTQTGDTLFFESTPIWGMIRQFNGNLVENIIGQTSERYFERHFRYSFDGGIVYSSWKDLNETELNNIFQEWISVNNGNLSATLDEQSDLKLQFKYERKGNDNTGELILEKIELNGRILHREFDFKTINKSIFSEIINDNIDLFNLTMNLTQKMYESGIVAEYVERKSEESESLLEDRDYIDLWKTVAEFYVMIFLYAIRFTNIYWKKDMLCEYLIQKGIFLCDCKDIVEMQQITQNFYAEIRDRGTCEIFRPKGFKYPMGRRNLYHAPLQINELCPIIINGIKYKDSSSLPYGWSLHLSENEEYNELISPDLNHYEVYFDVEINSEIVRIPGVISTDEVKPATQESDVLKKYNGEYLRLICYSSKCDEFIYNQVNIKDFGWNIGNASPLYKGLDNQYRTIVKAYEITKDFIDLTKYPWFGDYTLVSETLQPEYCTPQSGVSAYTTDELCLGVNLIEAEIIP